MKIHQKLEFIKKTRPKLEVGDIFYYKINGRFYVGIVINLNVDGYPEPDGNSITALYLNYFELDLKDITKEKIISHANNIDILTPPITTNKKPWTEGYFFRLFNININTIKILNDCTFARWGAVYDMDYQKVSVIPNLYLFGKISYYAREGIEYLIQLSLGLDYDSQEDPYRYYDYYIDDGFIDKDSKLPFWYYNSRDGSKIKSELKKQGILTSDDLREIELAKAPVKEYVTLILSNKDAPVFFDIQADKVLTLGERINELYDDAYMNGYNWEVLIMHYLELYNPELLVDLETDVEAGSCTFYYPKKIATYQRKAYQLLLIIKKLVENEKDIYAFLEQEADNIAWD